MNTEDRYYLNKDRNFYSKWLHSYKADDDSRPNSTSIKHNKKKQKKHHHSIKLSNNIKDESNWDEMHKKEYKISKNTSNKSPNCNKCKKNDVCECPWDIEDLCIDEFKINCNKNCKNQKQIRELFKFVIISIFSINKSMKKIQKAFCILVKLVIKDECIGNHTKATIRSIQNDLTSLEFVARKTLQDLICLKDEIL